MINPEERSSLFNFALKVQKLSGFIIGLAMLWSIWAITFSQLEYVFIAKILISLIFLGFGLVAPLIDFNESHATNPLWTGHARFHLVWQVSAMILTSVIAFLLLWFFESFISLIIVFSLAYLWIFSFFVSVNSMKVYDGKLNDINGVPPIEMNFANKKIVIDRNVQAISGAFLVSTYSLVLILL